jgi:ACS family sodium-dependent inorganic phosphate cotransporter-like MFS transporter 5
MEETLLQQKDRHASFFCSTRFVIIFWCWTGLILVYSMRVNLSVAVNPMQSQFHWTNSVKGFVLGSFFIGYMFGQIPGGYLATKYGGKWVFGIGVFSTAILTILLPLAACGSLFCPKTHQQNTTTTPSSSYVENTSHLLSLDILRVFMGMFESVTYPALMELLSKWSPPNERSRIVSLTFSGAQIGTAIAFPLAAYIASQDIPDSTTTEKVFERWPGVFYIFGFAGLLWFIGWCMFVFSSPRDHPRISKIERIYIEQSQLVKIEKELNQHEQDQNYEIQGKNDLSKLQSSPTTTASLYWLFLTNSASLVIILNHFTNNWSLYLMLCWMPSYMSKMLDFDLASSGILFLPYLMMAVFTWIAGGVADWLITKRKWTKRSTRIFMQLIGNLIPAVNFILLGFIHDRNWALFIMIIAVSSSGAAYPGYSANCLDICPKYTGILYSVSNTLATIPGIVAPILAGAIVGMPPTFLQWQIVFSIAAGLYIIGNIFYVKYARGDVVEELNREIL